MTISPGLNISPMDFVAEINDSRSGDLSFLIGVGTVTINTLQSLISFIFSVIVKFLESDFFNKSLETSRVPSLNSLSSLTLG